MSFLAGVIAIGLACHEPSAPAVLAVTVKLPVDSAQFGDTVLASATVATANGPVSSATVIWQSLDSAVATVDSTGRIVAHQQGIARIVATANGRSGQATLRVVHGDIVVYFFDEPGMPPQTLIPDTATIQGDVSSRYELVSFTANAAGRRAPFVPQPYRPYCGTCKKAVLDLSGLPIGPIDVTITATDVRGTSRSMTRTFIHDSR